MGSGLGSLTGKPVLFDSNILIDQLRGHRAAFELIEQYAGDRAISVVTWIEVMAGPSRQQRTALQLLSRFRGFQLSPKVAIEAAAIRRDRSKRRLKLPDAVILATARVHGRVLLTRNDRDFSPGEDEIIVPYRL